MFVFHAIERVILETNMEKLTEQDGKSLDVVNENLEALKGIFPSSSFWHFLSIPSSFSPLPFCKDQGLLKDLRKKCPKRWATALLRASPFFYPFPSGPQAAPWAEEALQ